MTETQQTIAAWGQHTFGQPVPAHIAARMVHEMFELTTALQQQLSGELPDAQAKIEDECADLGIMLLQIVELIGADFQVLIDRKMAINRHRTWALDPVSGTMRHVE
jgi:NTP pyrophosphatase (non-canonical NTP hydrolase)